MEQKEDYRFANKKEYNAALDMFISKKHIKERDIGYGKDKHKYLPIHIKEPLADYVFAEWNVIEENYKIIQGPKYEQKKENGKLVKKVVGVNDYILYTVKLLYVPDYPGAEEKFCTGTAAKLVQATNNCYEYQLPGVRSDAISNALQGLGNIFGRNLPRSLSDTFSLRAVGGKKDKAPETKTKPEPLTPNEKPLTKKNETIEKKSEPVKQKKEPINQDLNF